MRFIFRIFISLIFLSNTLICSGLTECQSTSSYWPAQKWRSSPPEKQGMDSEQLIKLFDFVAEHNINIHSLLIVRNGYVVLDTYFYPNTKGVLHDLASVTKSIISTLIGIAVDKGHIKNVNQPVLDFFPELEIANLDKNKKNLTIEHLLKMTTGFCRDYSQGERQLEQMRQTDDWVQFMLDQPLLTLPGEEFAYCSGASQLLSAIITQATGMKALDFARRHLFEPLGIRDVIWPEDPQRNNTGWGDFFMHPQDMAKIGYLFLNGGKWEDEQVISTDWIKQATERHITLDDGEGYGYRWWLSNELPGLYEARGRGGQRICIFPEKNSVIVFTGSGFEPGDVGEFIIASIQSDESLPENPDGYALLQKRIKEAGESPVPKPVPDLPPAAGKISGRTYIFESNDLGLISFSLFFEKRTEASFNLVEDDHTEINLIGLDGVYRFSPHSRFDLPEALRGHWESDQEFHIEYNEFANNHLFRMWFRFDGDNASMRISENTGLVNTVIKARIKE